MSHQPLVLIDGMYYLWRSFSVPFEFSSSKGTPLHVLTMFLKLLRRSVSVFDKWPEPPQIVVVFDSEQGVAANKQLLSDYKANRRTFAPDEDSPYAHLPQIRKALDYLDIANFRGQDHEADDYIASLAVQKIGQNNKCRAYIFSADSDFFQLLNDQIHQVRLLPKNKYEIITPATICSRLRVTPKQYVTYKSLVGDNADNIPGVSGIGPVRAARIINKEMPFNWTEHEEVLARNQKLITLKCDIDVNNLAKKISTCSKLGVSNPELFAECGL